MNHASPQSPETAPDLSFGERFRAITDRSLCVENINTYADDALADAIEIVSDAVNRLGGGNEQITVEKEREALAYFGLDPDTIETTLDRIASVADEIRGMDETIEKITRQMKQVIIPPENRDLGIVAGVGSFETKRLMPRLKTLLFILSKEFEVDLTDANQLKVTTGILTESMMRSASYNLVEVPIINRTVLVCDEEGNITYVFDNEVLEQYGISPDDFYSVSKNDIDDFIEADGLLGRRVRYTSEYVPRLIAALSQPFDTSETELVPDPAGKYLQKPFDAPEGILSARGIREMLDVHAATLGKAIEVIRDNLGEVRQYRFYSKVTEGYDGAQIEQIRTYLEEHGLLIADAPEGALSFSRLKDKFGVSPATLKEAIITLEDSLGQVKRYRMGSKRKPAEAYDKDQQDMIAEYLISLGKLKPIAPEGVVSLAGITKLLKVDRETIENVVNALWGDRSDVPQYKFGAVTTYGFDEVQQAAIRGYLEERTDIFAESIPEGYMTASGISKYMHINYYSVMRAIDTLGETLGEPEIFRASDQPSKCYSPKQIQEISSFLEGKGFFADEAPEGFMATSRFAREMHVSHNLVKAAIQELGDEFGEMRKFRFGPSYTEGMSPVQQAMVRMMLSRETGEPAPSGILSKNGIAKKYGIDKSTIDRALKHVADELGEIKKYQFSRVTTEGYDESQQEIIRVWIERNTKRVKNQSRRI